MNIESLDHVVRSRVRVFLRHTWLVTIVGTAALAVAISGVLYITTKPTVMRIAAGPAKSANAMLVQLLAEKMEHDGAKIRFAIVPTDGPKESAQAMSSGNADLAVLPSTIGNSPDWPVIAILRQNVMAFIVPAPGATAAKAANVPSPATTPPATTPPGTTQPGTTQPGTTPPATTPPATTTTPATATPVATTPASPAAASKGKSAGKGKKGGKNTGGKNTGNKSASAGKSDKSDDDDKSDDSSKLDKVPQLTGKRIGIVTGNEATTDMLAVVLNHYGITLDPSRISRIDPDNVAAAVRANQVDVLFVAGSATGKAISDAVAAATQNGVAPSFIEIDQADGIAARDPAFDSIDIDAGTFGGNPPSPDDSLKSLKFAEYLVARKSYNHTAIARLARLIYTSRLALAAGLPGEVKIEAPSTDKDADVNVHPGALTYLTDNEQSFFDEYGNDIFYGMLIFPVIGTGIASVANYLRSNTRTRRLRLLQRVLDLVRKAHAAQSLEMLEQLQIEADNLVIAIIHQSEHEEFEETVRMSFSFALDQLRFAIAGRRTAILDRVGDSSAAAAA